MIKNRFARWSLAIIFIVLITILAGNIWIIAKTQSTIYSKSEQDKIPENTTALVLGTSRYRSNGQPNPYFHGRIKAAAELYHSGKLSGLLLSGSTEDIYYDEPRTMRAGLLKLGVPDSVITRDPGGSRTITSILRAQKAFQIDTLTIISNRFHLYRALFIAQQNNLHAIGYACEYVPVQTSFLTRIRELIARIRAIVDVYFFPTSRMDLSRPVVKNETE